MRIPHHAHPERWLHRSVWIQGALVEWNARVTIARRFEQAEGEAACRVAEELRNRYRATRFVVPAKRRLRCSELAVRYHDNRYVVYAWYPLLGDGG